jgi:hypothetical protein
MPACNCNGSEWDLFCLFLAASALALELVELLSFLAFLSIFIHLLFFGHPKLPMPYFPPRGTYLQHSEYKPVHGLQIEIFIIGY